MELKRCKKEMITKIGIIGCGNIGGELARYCSDEKTVSELILYDKYNTFAQTLAKQIIKKKSKKKIIIAKDVSDVVQKSDLIIEAAHPAVVEEIVRKSVASNKPCMLMSSAGLIGKEDLLDYAIEKKSKVYIPSGAIAGIDAIKSMALEQIISVKLTMTKNPKSLAGAPYIIEKKINLSSIKTKKTIFSGHVKDAVRGFPQNINVSATLQLATGFKNIKIEIIADPKTSRNTHEILVEGSAGIVSTKSENVPSKNEKTSKLAILSAITVLKQILDSVHIGT